MRVATLFVLSNALLAADFTGTWVAERQRPNGTKTEFVFELVQKGNSLTGQAKGQFGEMPISNGRVQGDTAAFEQVLRTSTEKRTIVYDAKLSGDEMEIATRMQPAAPGVPRPMQAKRLTPDAIRERVAAEAARPKPALPALRDLPWNGLAKTPPMGWNSWNHFRLKIDDATVRGVADTIASNGMKAAGYIYINIDDGWEGKRDTEGVLHTNERFPDMKALADYVHGKGLKLGIYSSPGPQTCGGFEGSYLHEEQDAKMYAGWGIDYLKYDWCSAAQVYRNSDMRAVYQKMGEALRKTGRPIVYSLCQYGREGVEQWGPKVGGNSWRTTGDIRDSWQSLVAIGFAQNGLERFAGPGHWNDPDMLEVGNGGMTATEYQTHMSLWAVLAAPLLAGNDLRNMTEETKSILLHEGVIAIDQDPLGKQGYRVSEDGASEVWLRQLSGGRFVLALFKKGGSPAEIRAQLPATGSWKARDVWARKDLGEISGNIVRQTPSHGTALILLAK